MEGEVCGGVGGSMAVAVGVAVAMAVAVALALAGNIALAVDFLDFIALICTYREIDWFPNCGIFYFSHGKSINKKVLNKMQQ